MRTILFLTPRMIVGGAERYLLEKAQWLIRHQHRVLIVSEGGPWEHEIERLGGTHHRLGFIGTDPYLYPRSRFLGNLVRLNEIASAEKVSIVEATHLAPAVWGYHLSRLYGVPCFLNVLSGREFFEGKDTYSGFLQALDRKGLYYNSEMCNRIIEEKKKIRLSRCVEIPIPVREVSAPPSDAAPSTRFVLTVCRMAPEKRYVKSVIRDFGKLVRDLGCSDLNLVVVGDGECFPEVEALARRVNRRIEPLRCRVLMKGTVVGRELDALFSGCLFYVGTGTTVVTAARSKKSVVLATGEKACSKWSTGFFGEDGHPSIGFRREGAMLAPFYEQMKVLLQNPRERERLEQQSHRLYREKFETEAVMQKWLREYDRILRDFNPKDGDLYQEDALFYFFKKLKHRFVHRTQLSA